MIKNCDHDLLLNSKSEWGINSVPRQRVQYKDVLWENRRTPEEDPNQIKRSRGGTKMGTETGTQENNQFSDQYCQRRKRLKLEKVALEASRRSSRQQKKKVAPRRNLQALQKESRQQEAQRNNISDWLQIDADRST